ncbi:S8 family peptidase [Geodermatophilus marinus]|uniref:S8 family peptidase n=1 Tax=Geodermatophilus sp. LHW52908 TaxID=2303986 RepID=UPI000E3ED5FC|nr:S8 family serine peptidase [Geodermatophilus sp. LHW52908]RFU21659.1 hypothetical protein D0Z06_10725 [Geodermatophilus sp. LHW52908]
MPEVPVFRHAPQDRRTPGQIRQQRAAVRVQIDRWVQQTTDGARRRALEARALTVLRDRQGAAGTARFEVEDDEYPVAPNRLVVRREDAAGVLAELRDRYAPYEVPVPDLEEICVLQDVGAGPRRLRSSGSVARALPAGRVAPSHVVLLGAVRKAEGGPEPSGPQDGGLWERGPAQGRGDGGPDAPFVVVVDNGVTAECRADGWLAGLARTDNLDLLDVVPQDSFLDLGAGHGTFVAGIVQQVAPAARIDVRRALDTDGVGDEVEVAREIVRAAADGADIVNLSLGFATPDGEEPPLALEAAVRAAIRTARERGRHLLLVCAAGNYGDERLVWPAAFCRDPEFAEHVVAVAALRLDHDDDTHVVGAEWSTRGWVTCSTPGQGVVSTYVVGRESPRGDVHGPDCFPPNAWATWSGTSFAAPQVAGAIARLVQEDGLTAREACDALLSSGRAVVDGYGTSLRILPV